MCLIAGMEHTSQKKMFAMEVEDRTVETIEKILKTYVLCGLIIHTDGCKPYVTVCKNLRVVHKTVNHKNPGDGIHTNTIEGNNTALKIVIKVKTE